MTTLRGLRRLAVGDLSTVLRWRNHPDIRRFMLTQHEFGEEEHRQWFERADADPSRCLLIYAPEEIPLGYVGFSGLTGAKVADWGFYLAPDAARGAGVKLGVAALRYAFEELGVHKVCGQALAFNVASINFHRKLGFQQEGVLREQHLIVGAYHDLVCFGLLRPEWDARRVELDLG